MKSTPENPPGNAMPAGIACSELAAAIQKSGYPLQGVVAASLVAAGFSVTEEWGFIDDDKDTHRSLDIYAHAPLPSRRPGTLHAIINVLVECKRSQQPFVFFQQVVRRDAPDFPSIVGLPKRYVDIQHVATGWSRTLTPSTALGLHTDPFVISGPPVCASFSKAEGHKDKVTLSGTEPFNSIVLPLIKAFRFATSRRQVPERDQSLYPTLTVCVAVLDAPMLIVESPEKANAPIFTPWARVVRHESATDPRQFSTAIYAIDVVHAHYFAAFLRDHLMPLATLFADRAGQVEDVLRFGGNVADTDKWTWDSITPRAAPG